MNVIEEKNQVVNPKIQIHLEILRIISCFFVIINHTSGIGFLALDMSKSWIASVFLFISSKTAVPIFFMVSGALLLKKQDDYSVILKRIVKIIIPFTIASAFYFWNRTRSFNIKDFIISFYSTTQSTALWYLYSYLALLISLPILQKLISAMEKKDYIYYFSVSFLYYSVLSLFISYFNLPSINRNFDLPLFNSIFFYFIMGHYLNNIIEINSKKTFKISIPIYVFFTILGVFLTFKRYIKNNGESFLFWDNRNGFHMLIPAICLFLIIKSLTEIWNIPNTIKKIIIKVSSYTFGVYLISDFLLPKTKSITIIYLQPKMNPVLAQIICQLMTFIIALVIVSIYFLLKKITLNILKTIKR